MRQSTDNTILEYIRTRPGVTYSEMYNGLQWSRPTIARYVKAMEKAGEVRRQVLRAQRRRHGFWATGAMS